MLSHIERPILADQIRRVAQQRQFPDSQTQILNSAFSTLVESRRTEGLDGEMRAALTSIFMQSNLQEISR
jgi:hypothetical protein